MFFLRFLFLALSLLSSSLALTVTDSKASGGVVANNLTPIQFVFDATSIDGRNNNNNHHKNLYRGGRVPNAAARRMPPRASGGACCADYPFCGCPKIDVPTSLRAETVSSDAPKASGCCGDYPFCSCPKI